MDATAQEIVTLARSERGKRGCAARVATMAATGARKACFSNAAAIAEAVMGRDAWDTNKNSEYKLAKFKSFVLVKVPQFLLYPMDSRRVQ